MSWRHYQVRDEIEVCAPIERVFAMATDLNVVPLYENGITKLEVLEEISGTERLVRSHLKVMGMSTPYVYRYKYAPYKSYVGTQESGMLFRGYFGFSFESTTNGTKVVHREGIFSRFPLVPLLIGFIYFKLLSRGGIGEELRKLKDTVESTDGNGGPD